MISSNSRDKTLFWCFMTTACLINAMAFPDVWMTWAMLLVGLVVMNEASKKLGGLIICTSWATMGGLLTLFTLFLLLGDEEKKLSSLLLVVSFIGWTLLLLTEKKKRTRWALFQFFAPLHMAVQLMTLSLNENQSLATVGLVIQAGIYLALIYNPNEGVQENQQTAPTMALRWIGMAMAGSMLIAAPLLFARNYINWEKELPSIGSLPAASTSNATVMMANFPELVPQNDPYWEQRDIYVVPQKHGQWATVDEAVKATQSMAYVDTLYNYHVYDVRKGVGEQTYKHTVVGSYSLHMFNMPGTISSSTLNISKAIDAIEDVRTQGRAMEDRQSWVNYIDKSREEYVEGIDALYLSIPDGDLDMGGGVDMEGARKNMPKTWAMVQEWKAEGLDDEQFIQRTLDYFRNNLAYHFDHQSMEPEHNELDWFLFTDKKGVCRHFSNAFALIMRMGGIRSRIRGGFYGGQKFEQDGLTGWTIRKRDAHAWTEVWKDGQGWVLIDPTAVVAVEKGIPEDKSLASRIFGGFSDVKWMDSFKTAGSAGSNQDPSHTQGVLENIRSKLLSMSADTIKNILLGALALLLVLTIMWWAAIMWIAYKKEDSRDRQWRLLKKALVSRGVYIDPSNGPRTIGKRGIGLWSSSDQTLWVEDVHAYERWKYSGQEDESLAKRLSNWRKQIKKQHPRRRNRP